VSAPHPLNPPPNAALAGMASETVYILQTWVAGRGGALQAGPQVGCRDAEAARRKAERLAPLRLGGRRFRSRPTPNRATMTGRRRSISRRGSCRRCSTEGPTGPWEPGSPCRPHVENAVL